MDLKSCGDIGDNGRKNVLVLAVWSIDRQDRRRPFSRSVGIFQKSSRSVWSTSRRLLDIPTVRLISEKSEEPEVLQPRASKLVKTLLQKFSGDASSITSDVIHERNVSPALIIMNH